MQPAHLPEGRLDSEVLGWLLDDFENASTLTSDVARALVVALEEAEVAASLERLSATGLVDRYVFDARSGNFAAAPEHADPATQQLWYLASAQGRRAASP